MANGIMDVAAALLRKNAMRGDEAAYDAALAGGLVAPADILAFKTNARRLGYSDDSGAGPGVMPTGMDDKQDMGRKPIAVYGGTDIPMAKRLVEYGEEDTRDPALKYKLDGTLPHAPGTGQRDLFQQQPTGSPYPHGLEVPYKKVADALLGAQGGEQMTRAGMMPQRPDPLAMLADAMGQGGQMTSMRAAETVPAPESFITSGAKLTEGQAKTAGYVTRALQAMPTLDEYQKELTDWVPQAAGGLPFGWGAGFQSANFQKAQQAGRQFLEAVIRGDTGATINESEYPRYEKTFLPQPGDKPEMLEQKRAARASMVAGLQLGIPKETLLALEEAKLKPITPSGLKPRNDLKSKYGLE